jgi:hypothetical protein
MNVAEVEVVAVRVNLLIPSSRHSTVRERPLRRTPMVWSHTMGDGLQIDADTNPRSSEGKYGGQGAQEGMFIPYMRLSTLFI